MTPTPKRRWLRFSLWTMFAAVTVFGLAIALALAALSISVMNGHPVSMEALNRVRAGMAKSEVRQLLGAPRTTEDRVWTYHNHKWCVVRIRFGTGGRVDEIDHDH